LPPRGMGGKSGKYAESGALGLYPRGGGHAFCPAFFPGIRIFPVNPIFSVIHALLREPSVIRDLFSDS
jgi:hypothetical protein